ncbi:MAG: alpha/beta fold hydrolase, partial [Miltoncostaeaceae bacterium]
ATEYDADAGRYRVCPLGSLTDTSVRVRTANLTLIDGDLGAPALVVSGEEDPLVPTWLSEELADELPDSSLAVIAGTAHVPQLERPDTIDLLIAAFLARLEQALTGDA